MHGMLIVVALKTVGPNPRVHFLNIVFYIISLSQYAFRIRKIDIKIK